MRHMKSLMIMATVMSLSFAGNAFAAETIFDEILGANVLVVESSEEDNKITDIMNEYDAEDLIGDTTETDEVIIEEIGESVSQEVGAGLPANCRDLGEFRLTSYCTCRKCSGKYGAKTASGTTCTVDRTIAVDPRVIPLGSWVWIDVEGEGWKRFHAEDTGGAVKGNKIDVYIGTNHSNCYQTKYNKRSRVMIES